MNDESRIKFITEVEVDGKIRVKKPLKLGRDNQRLYVRLNISSPMSLGTIKDVSGNYSPEVGQYPINGQILNISAGGVLVDLEEPVLEGDIVAMRFSLENMEPLEGILGLVKRCDKEDTSALVGIQFVNRDDLTDMLSQAELELLETEFSHFHERVQVVLSRYVYREDT